MQIVMVQLDSAWESPRANFDKVDALLAATPPERGALVVLPEMFATGFSLDVSKTCGAETRETEPFLRELAHRHGVTLVAGVTNPAGDCRGRNEALVLSPQGKEIARYLKQRPF